MLEAAVESGRLMAEGGTVLAAARIADARREALRIWASLTNQQPGEVLLRGSAVVSPEIAGRFHEAIERRAAGEPLAYVTGRAGFRRLELLVDRRVLIPRPETEGLVDLVAQQCSGADVVDVCTGSGCLALSVRQETTARSVAAVELSADALAVARHNACATALEVAFVRGDLTSALAPACADVVLSNPPYIARGEFEGLDGSVRDWEPRMALESGPDGLEATRRLLEDGRRILRAGGVLALELDASRAAGVVAIATGLGWQDVDVHADLFGRARYLTARRSE